MRNLENEVYNDSVSREEFKDLCIESIKAVYPTISKEASNQTVNNYNAYIEELNSKNLTNVKKLEYEIK